MTGIAETLRRAKYLPWSPPPGVDLSKYKLGPAFELFTVFEPAYGRSPRTDRARVDGFHLLLSSAIRGGLRWERDDAEMISRCFSFYGKYVFAVRHEAYTEACVVGNASACRSIERYLGFSPWYWPEEVRGEEGVPIHASSRGRLFVGAWVTANGAEWTVTSVQGGADHDKIVFCLYEEGRSAPVSKKVLDREKFAKFVSSAGGGS